MQYQSGGKSQVMAEGEWAGRQERKQVGSR